jgi:hypothetical protein
MALLGGRAGVITKGGEAEGAPEGGWEFEAWMVERLGDALAGYEAEEVLLRQELAALVALEQSKGRWWGWGRRGEKVGQGEAATAAGGGGGSRAQRIAEVREQLSSIEVLQAALRNEMGRYKK